MDKVLFIGTVWPEPASSAAGSRMLQLISFFSDSGYNIVFASTALKSEFSAELPNVECVEIEINSESFDKFIAEVNPTIVIFDRFMIEEQFGWRVSEVCPLALKILDTEDLHCLRKSREIALKSGLLHDNTLLLTEDIALREIASIWRCDLAIIISTVEMDLLQNVFGVDSQILYYLPLFVSASSQTLPYNQRANFMFIGNFLHKPNVDAVQQLKSSIWPMIRRELKVDLHIYGAYMPDKISQMHNDSDGFIVHGRAEDALAVISNSKVMLAPLRFGAGLKGKLLEAMAVGTPTVTTPIGAEGISETVWKSFIESDDREFADSAIKLYQDEESWNAAQQQGFSIIDQKFTLSTQGVDLIKRVELLKTTLVQHRQQNFIGRMLQHHLLRSTEYMSRWIQLKNMK